MFQRTEQVLIELDISAIEKYVIIIICGWPPLMLRLTPRRKSAMEFFSL